MDRRGFLKSLFGIAAAAALPAPIEAIAAKADALAAAAPVVEPAAGVGTTLGSAGDYVFSCWIKRDSGPWQRVAHRVDKSMAEAMQGEDGKALCIATAENGEPLNGAIEVRWSVKRGDTPIGQGDYAQTEGECRASLWGMQLEYNPTRYIPTSQAVEGVQYAHDPRNQPRKPIPRLVKNLLARSEEFTGHSWTFNG